MPKYFQGFFKCRNPSKYLGDTRDIVYRSGLEFQYMMKLDNDPSVVIWESETFAIPYHDPISNRIRRYFPDFRVTKRNKEGIKKTYVVEVKPDCQTKPPKRGKKGKKSDRRYLNESLIYGKNSAKWEAARQYCEINGFEFIILTEKQLKVNKWQ